MSISNYTTNFDELKYIEIKNVKNTHISFEDRIKIETLIKENYSTLHIAKSINRPLRTVQNEIASRKIFILKKKFCKDCKNNNNCDATKNCEIYLTFGKCGVPECQNCPKKYCNKFKNKLKCKNENTCNTCDSCTDNHNCSKSKSYYSANAANDDYYKKRKNCKQELKVYKIVGLLQYIQKQILEKKYSPDAITGRIKNVDTSFSDSVCTTTLYSAINNNKIPKVSNLNLKLKCRYRLKKQKPVSTGANIHRVGREIDKRTGDEILPIGIGHYELDLVEGIKGGNLLLTFIDRFSSEVFIRKILNKSQENVHNALNDIEKYIINKYGENTIKSITTDNGSEFKDFTNIEKSCLNDKKRCNLFYAMPYCSWQKGKIEQANWVIRTYIYKGQDIGEFSERQISNIEKNINNMPRKRLKYLTAFEFTNNSLLKTA